MAAGIISVNKQVQAVSLPASVQFPEQIKKVTVCVVGQDRILSPVGSEWDSFFLSDDKVSNDFMMERASQK